MSWHHYVGPILDEHERLADTAVVVGSMDKAYQDYRPTPEELNTEQDLINWLIPNRPLWARAAGAFPDEGLGPCAIVQFDAMDAEIDAMRVRLAAIPPLDTVV